MIRRTFITFVMLSGLLSAFVYTLLIAYNTSVLFVGGRQVALVGPPVLSTHKDPHLSPERPHIFEELEAKKPGTYTDTRESVSGTTYPAGY